MSDGSVRHTATTGAHSTVGRFTSQRRGNVVLPVRLSGAGRKAKYSPARITNPVPRGRLLRSPIGKGYRPKAGADLRYRHLPAPGRCCGHEGRLTKHHRETLSEKMVCSQIPQHGVGRVSRPQRSARPGAGLRRPVLGRKGRDLPSEAFVGRVMPPILVRGAGRDCPARRGSP